MGRHVPIKIRREVEWKFGLHCGYPGCKKPARDLHHTKRFSIVKRHSADEIVPLCKIHHELAHVGAIRKEHLETKNWHTELIADQGVAIAKVDRLVQRKKWRRTE